MPTTTYSSARVARRYLRRRKPATPRVAALPLPPAPLRPTAQMAAWLRLCGA